MQRTWYGAFYRKPYIKFNPADRNGILFRATGTSSLRCVRDTSWKEQTQLAISDKNLMRTKRTSSSV